MSKCGICGSTLHLAFTKRGTRILICPNIQSRVSSLGIGNLKQLELWCDMQITNKQVQPVKRLTKEQAKAVNASVQYDGLRDSFNRLLGETVLSDLRQQTYNIINDNQLLAQTNLAIMLDLPLHETPKLFNAAIRLSRSMGITPLKGIEAISKGIGRQSRKILDNIGVIFKRSEAYEWYAQEHGLTKLDEIQKTEAWKLYAIKLVIEKAQIIGEPSAQELKRKQAECARENGAAKLGRKLRE